MENYERGFGIEENTKNVPEANGEEPSVIVEEVTEAESDNRPEEKTIKRHNRDTGRTRLNQIQREKMQAIDERDRIASEYQRIIEENDKLRRISEYSTSAALTQYESGAQDRLKMAKDKKIQALEAGDVKAQVEADEMMSAATAELVQLQYSRSQQAAQESQEREQYEAQIRNEQSAPYVPPDISNRHIAESWVMDNDWFDGRSPNYNQELAGYVERLTDRLDAQLMRDGNGYQIFTPEYFQYIDNHVSQYVNQRNYKPQEQYDQEPVRRQPMSYSSPVAPVRSGYNSGARNEPRTVRLTRDEIDLARRSGVTPETFARYKEQEKIKQKQKGDNRRY